MKKLIFVFLALPLIAGCSTAQLVKKQEDLLLREFNQVYIFAAIGVSALAIADYDDPAAAIESILAAHQDFLIDEPTEAALKKFKTDLTETGFNVVEDYSQADAWIELYISRPQRDFLNRWVTDQAGASFISKKNKQIFAHFNLKASLPISVLIKPSVIGIVRNLAAKIKKYY